MHHNSICHRDITPFNLIYDEETKKIKLIDFGISKDLRTQGSKMYTKTGNQQFIAPEMVSCLKYDLKVDIWMTGITLYYLLTGKLPYKF